MLLLNALLGHHHCTDTCIYTHPHIHTIANTIQQHTAHTHASKKVRTHTHTHTHTTSSDAESDRHFFTHIALTSHTLRLGPTTSHCFFFSILSRLCTMNLVSPFT